MRKLIYILLFITNATLLIAGPKESNQSQYQLSDSANISLLTNTPWDQEVYALFGHTAIRVNDPLNNIDVVFNYGIFNMSEDNFLYLYVKGETDYIVNYISFPYYFDEYAKRGVGIREQIFNLTKVEKQNLFDALIINSLPENRVYRYNHFYNNCATRPRDIIEKYIDGKVLYTLTNKDQTYRDLVHECVDHQPWVKFGIDLVIGADADNVITDRQKDFLPKYLMNAYNGAIIKGDSTQRDLVLSSSNLLEQSSSTPNPVNTPLYLGIGLLLLTILLSIIFHVKKKCVFGKIYDTILFFIAGIAGSIIFFLMFFSEHPTTNPNWNIVWLNPLQLIIALLFFVKPLSKCLSYYHFINFVALLLFLMAWSLIPQQLEVAFIPYILSIAIRSGMNVLIKKTRKSKAKHV